MKETYEKITDGAEHEGKSCSFCRQSVDPSQQVVVCPRCGQIHHIQCWKQNGGCARIGCPQVAKAVRGERPAGDGPPPPVSKRTVFLGIALVMTAIIAMLLWPKAPDPALGRAKVVFLGEAGYELQQVMSQLTEEFNAASETIYIDLQLLPAHYLDQKLFVLVGAGDAPDLIALNYERFSYFEEQEVLLPLGKDPRGAVVYGIQHPAQLTKLVIWSATEYPEESLEVLHYFLENIPPADLDELEKLQGIFLR